MLRAIRAWLDACSLPYRVHEHIAVSTIEEARREVPELTIDLFKTVAFEIKHGSRIILVATEADRRVDYRALARLLGCSRRELRLLPGERVRTELGIEPGGVGPFPVLPNVDVLIDEGSPSQRQVKVGGGLRTVTVELAFEDLVRCSGARVASISRP